MLITLPLEELVVTDSILMRDDIKAMPQVRTMSIARLMSEAISRIAHNQSVSSLLYSLDCVFGTQHNLYSIKLYSWLSDTHSTRVSRETRGIQMAELSATIKSRAGKGSAAACVGKAECGDCLWRQAEPQMITLDPIALFKQYAQMAFAP